MTHVHTVMHQCSIIYNSFCQKPRDSFGRVIYVLNTKRISFYYLMYLEIEL